MFSSCNRIIIAVSSMVLALILAGPVPAKVSGPCSNCHTMHYSQDNSVLDSWQAGGPHQALLRSDCGGCHTGVNSAGGSTPYVMATSEPTYNSTGTESDTTTLAGGSFYWVQTNDAHGHNVASLTGPDNTLSLPPGFDNGRAAVDGSVPGSGSWPTDQQVTCAGTYGCHGSHDKPLATNAIRGGHHHNQGGARVNPGSDVPQSYRFLLGVAGYEDAAWEFRPTATQHNQYKGVDNPGTSATDTISSLCARCHGAYHNDASYLGGSSSPWLRHPTDYDMGNTAAGSPYRDYGGTNNTYQPAVPVGSSDISTVQETIDFNGDAIVTCLSCHRAHGSPHYKAMRWDYAGSVTGGLCTECHSNKD